MLAGLPWPTRLFFSRSVRAPVRFAVRSVRSRKIRLRLQPACISAMRKFADGDIGIKRLGVRENLTIVTSSGRSEIPEQIKFAAVNELIRNGVLLHLIFRSGLSISCHLTANKSTARSTEGKRYCTYMGSDSLRILLRTCH